MVTFLTPLASNPEGPSKGSIGHAFTVCIPTENQNQARFYPFVLHEISVLIEQALGHLRYLLTDVPPQPNSPPDCVFDLGRGRRGPGGRAARPGPGPGRASPACRQNEGLREGGPPLRDQISETTSGVVVFQGPTAAGAASHLFYAPRVVSQSRTRVKLNRVFFRRRFRQARSLGCGFAGL